MGGEPAAARPATGAGVKCSMMTPVFSSVRPDGGCLKECESAVLLVARDPNVPFTNNPVRPALRRGRRVVALQ